MLIVNVLKLSEDNYNEHTSTGLTLVDIKAEWCRPCLVLSPIIDELSDEYRDKVVFGKLDADDNSEKIKELGVRNIPTILLYKDGEIVERSVGMVSKIQLKELIDKHLQVENNQ
jgi:thioredoxin 1